jgi:Ser/Thr protein kinase RdoA (MazF antagonist)
MLYDAAFLENAEESLREALPRWGLNRSTSLSLLTISENATFIAEDRTCGRRVVLRVHRPGYHSEAEIESELAWISALRESGVVETPRPLPATSGRLMVPIQDGMTRRWVVAFEHMTGQEPTPGDRLEMWYARLGAITARLHAHSRTWSRPAGFVRKIWDFDTTIGPRALWGDWRGGLGLTAEGRDVLEQAEQFLRRETRRYGSGWCTATCGRQISWWTASAWASSILMIVVSAGLPTTSPPR